MTQQHKQPNFSHRYFDHTVLNAEPAELIRMLLQKAMPCVREAREHLRARLIAERGLRIGDAYACIAELRRSLRPEVAPEMVERLEGLYRYMQQRLLRANMAQSDAPLAEVLNLLTTLEEGWRGASKQLVARYEATENWSSTAGERKSGCGQAVIA